ncbi:MAG: ATP-binding protein [Bacteroidales bacterium]|nr:ATP-binding protein [Bacteroidales bacterium]
MMDKIDRLLQIDLPPGQSAFLWGPRKTGKTTFLRQRFPDSLVFDFLQTDRFLAFSNRPSLLREQLAAASEEQLRHPIILDEVQKVPMVLDEVHWLIENRGLSFILCGSSARKLKRGRANLLGGRAWRFEMFPFVSSELDSYNLLDVLNKGMIPSHYLQHDARRSLKAYVQDYLKEEVFAEGLVRNLPAFSRFFDSMTYSHGELTNFLNISRDCGIDSKTVKEYYQILVDTLMGVFIHPFKKRQSRQVITRSPKFYLFDTGVAGVVTKRVLSEEKGEIFGKAFEHFILLELLAYRSYKEKDFEIEFWRTKSGIEVDFILGNGEMAIEVKGKSQIVSKDLRPIRSFRDEFSPKEAIVVCNEPAERIVDNIRIVSYRIFLEKLWAEEYQI